ncbi:uncharacterized protein LOC123672393 isoform X2 [Harmonia axyridis]|uniref:uncharacterized protein LOC123672393 isoform X2 n=1 Tax=Harmonia axyridis TaxID=115357 RepID=UPI001E2760B4|nr:uncharacterized protein LOC123672393 isoform X2 [Harmonia axyridis]
MFGKYVSRKLIGNKLFYFGLAKSLSPFNEIYLRYPLSVNDILQLNISTSVSNRTTKQKNRSFEFSDEQKVKILQVLNNESQDYFTRLNIPPAQIKKLAVWKTKRGPFNSVVDVLDIEGIDIKNLIKICRSIIRDKPVSINRNLTDVKNRTLTSPVLTDDIIQSSTTTVGLHLGPAGISWAHLTCQTKNLNHWGTKNFSDFPIKVNSWENLKLALQILKDIPTADLYIFESPPGTGLQSQIAKTNYLQQIELLSMLFTLLNTSKKHNKKVGDNLNDVENIVYYVRNKITARLFKTWVGTESVSTISTIQKLFKYGEFDLPCSPISVDQKLINSFEKQPSSNKELMGQSLLLTITFLELCIFKNPNSFARLKKTE